MRGQTLAMASRVPLDDSDQDELERMARQFVKNEDIVNVAFADASGKVLAAYCPDPDFHWQELTPDGPGRSAAAHEAAAREIDRAGVVHDGHGAGASHDRESWSGAAHLHDAAGGIRHAEHFRAG